MQIFTRRAQRLGGEEFEDLTGAADFARRLGQRLALLARQKIRQLRAARENLRADLVERVRAHLRRASRPRGEGLRCRGDGRAHLRGIRARIFAHDVRGIGGIDVARGVGALDPFAANEVSMHQRDLHGCTRCS